MKSRQSDVRSRVVPDRLLLIVCGVLAALAGRSILAGNPVDALSHTSELALKGTTEPSFGEWRRLTPEALAKRWVQASAAELAVPPTDLRTTNNGSAQNETSIAVDPNDPASVVGGFNDYNMLSSGFAGNGVIYSTDGGNTFTYHATGVPLAAGFNNSGGDPALAFDTRGRVYYAHIASSSGNTFLKNSGVFVARSDDGGVNWNATVAVVANTFDGSTRVNFEDKEFIDVDRNPGSPFRDRVYISWTRFYEGNYPGTSDAGGGDIMFSYSTDAGQTWTAPIRLSAPVDLPGNGGPGTPGRSFVQGSEPEVGPDGSVYVAFKFQGHTAVRRSTDGGVTFGAASFPFGTGDGAQVYDHDLNGTNGVQIPGWSFRVNSFPNIEAHPTLAGQVYVVATDDPTDDATGDGGNIVFARSTDFGATWGGVTTLNDDDGTASQIFPWMAVSDAGIIQVIWYDARNASGASTMDVYAACSGDGGLNFSANSRVTDQTFNPNTNQFAGDGFFGDYNGLGAGTAAFHALWTDGRNGEQEIYYDRPACCDFDAVPPTIICPSDVTVQCKGNGGIMANDPDLAAFFAGVSAADDCDDDVAITNNAPSFIPVGTTTVTFTATDNSGNSASCTADINVIDDIPPVITCPSDRTFECDSIGDFGAPTATDQCDPDPVITLLVRDSVPGDCPQEYVLTLSYEAMDFTGNADSCQQVITVTDTTPPTITCPDTVHIDFTSPTEAELTFTVTATDNCTDSPNINCDSVSGSVWQIGYHEVECVADDGCGNADTCSFEFLLVPLDIKPGSCPNPLNLKAQGGGRNNEYDLRSLIQPAGATPDEALIPVAILGTAEIDVTDLDVTTITLAGVPSIKSAYVDVASPVASNPDDSCECTTAGPDGYTDLLLKFDRQLVIEALGALDDGQSIMVQIAGFTIDGVQFAGGDCMLIRGTKGPSLASVEEGGDEVSLGSYPNPFNAATTVTYVLPQSGHVNLSVFNVLGQKIATLVDGEQIAGRHDRVWNGRTDFGATVASGVYFFRLQTGSAMLTRKMMLLK